MEEKNRIRNIAQSLINDPNVPICRSTGIRIREQLSEDDRPPHHRVLPMRDPCDTHYSHPNGNTVPVTSNRGRTKADRPPPHSQVIRVNRNDDYRFGPQHIQLFDEQDYYSDQYDEVDEIEQFNLQSRKNIVAPEQYCTDGSQNDEIIFRRRSPLKSPKRRRNINDVQHYGTETARADRRYKDSRRTNERVDQNRRLARYNSNRNNNTEQYTGESYEYSSSSDSEMEIKRGKHIKSGISAKPNSSVREQMKYPHFSLGQQPGFIGSNIQFHQLSYKQFLAGEMATIQSTCGDCEREGCIALLQNIMLWKLRNTYAHVIHKIENQEIDWTADWERFE